MKRTIILAAALLVAVGAAAQQAGRIHRTEVVPYDTRHDAEARNRAGSGHLIDFAPRTLASTADGSLVEAQIEIPYVWTDGNVYLHLENVPSAYALQVNDHLVGKVEDFATPAEFALTPYIREGANDIRLILYPGDRAQLNAQPVIRKPYENSYLYYQNKRSIRDFEIALVPDSAGRNFGVLDLRIIAQNSFNYNEPVEVGYDIYSPQGKLLDFNIVEVTIPGRSVDTVHFSPYIYHTFENKWEAGAKNPPLYKVMLFTRRNGAYKEYMPLKIGFGKTELIEGRIMRLGRVLKLNPTVYNAASDRKTTLTELKTLKNKGFNTITPEYPQPAWFYELCDQLGLYVIDRANIDAPEKRDDRRVGGTPSNDPALADEYLERVRAMYYRSRNFTCVIAYSLGSDSGNGYNMYKAYEWLKGVERSRPVIYTGADGEWNTDL